MSRFVWGRTRPGYQTELQQAQTRYPVRGQRRYLRTPTFEDFRAARSLGAWIDKDQDRLYLTARHDWSKFVAWL